MWQKETRLCGKKGKVTGGERGDERTLEEERRKRGGGGRMREQREQTMSRQRSQSGYNTNQRAHLPSAVLLNPLFRLSILNFKCVIPVIHGNSR